MVNDKNDDEFSSLQAIYTAKKYMQTSKGPYCLLVKRQTFLPYKLTPPEDRLMIGLISFNVLIIIEKFIFLAREQVVEYLVQI